jgi:xylulokinase
VVLDVTGTWETVQLVTTEPALDPRLPAMGMTVQAHPAKGKYAIWGGNPAADMLEWYREQFGHDARQKAAEQGGADWDHLMAAATESPPGARGTMFLPHMSGSGCPVVDQRSLGAFVGLSKRTTAGDMVRAVIEGLDYQTLDIMTAMESVLVGAPTGGGETNLHDPGNPVAPASRRCVADAGIGNAAHRRDSGATDSAPTGGSPQASNRLGRFIAVGGAVRNEFWMQNKADVIGRPIEVPAIEEATPLGAAILAGIGIGVYRDVQDAYCRVYRPGKVYQPDPQRAEKYAQWFPVYRQLYHALKPVNHQLG